MKRLLVALVTLVLIGMSAQPAYAGIHDANIKNIGTSRYNASLVVCKDWGSTTCGINSARGVLGFGQNAKSKLGWSDTDGYWVPKGFVSSQGYVGPRWVKTPGRNGATYSISIRRR